MKQWEISNQKKRSMLIFKNKQTWGKKKPTHTSIMTKNSWPSVSMHLWRLSASLSFSVLSFLVVMVWNFWSLFFKLMSLCNWLTLNSVFWLFICLLFKKSETMLIYCFEIWLIVFSSIPLCFCLYQKEFSVFPNNINTFLFQLLMIKVVEARS